MEIILFAIVVLVALTTFDAHLWPSTAQSRRNRRRATRRIGPVRPTRRAALGGRRATAPSLTLFSPARRASYAGRWWWD
ncbi:MAG TPA: hypothetical protein GX702_15985 [Chloroflexi bacterium]|jgi:hypothetical protein|nr:hypothetical protein [Chloroflexota bacterium]